ncbi:hypothetical protein UC34_17255 [Pandoraea vervacti]|uniref:Uncharacterized protein n=1 Tax=Pandoraea vervacti TaxID=656178 RepID=A0ABN4FUB9_9BURK|nr:hypothetical protein [Pandoraea vervacti]AJP58247.1 hypothetical protein UC34_17255 [Pandoraea vervacti]
MSIVSDAPRTSHSLSTGTLPGVSTVLHLATDAMHCVLDSFRADFTGALACVRDSGLRHLLADAWHQAGRRFRPQAGAQPGVAGVTNVANVVDVGLACALSALTLGATCSYLWPELRALERAIGGGGEARRAWALQTDSQLRRRTLADVTAMRQCLAVFDATAPAANAQQGGASLPRRALAEMHIAEALLLHIADAPQSDLARSDRVSGLCQLMAHGLGFKLPKPMREALLITDERRSLIRDDSAFALLRDRLEPDWRHDAPGSPTFTVHPIDVQVFDPAETTDDLSAKTRNDRRLLTHPTALRRVRTRLTELFAASVRDDCGGTGDWRELAQRAMAVAAQEGLTCRQVLDALGVATRAGISARYAWRWSDEPAPAPGETIRPTIPLDVARWIARVMIVAGRPESSAVNVPCPARLAALVRGDTPPSLKIGSPDWVRLVDGIGAMGRDHWHASLAQVSARG